MNKLLCAGFARLWKNKIFWAGILLMPAFLVFVMLSDYRLMQSGGPAYTLDLFVPGCMMFFGCFTAVFAALFLGTEYSDGTIRNKLIAGHGRISLYLSTLLLTAAASLLVCAVSVLVTFAVGLPLFGPPTNLSGLLQKLGAGLLLILSYSALFTLPAMLIHNKPILSVTCVIAYFALLFAAIYVTARLEAPEYIENSYTLSVNGAIVPQDPYPNPGYLQGTARTVFEFFRDFLPTGQSLSFSQYDLPSAPRMCLFSLLLTLGVTAVGIPVFCRKDLK
ncbi:MAG: ABC transporter permease [bacterium]|nr:ABC transporter permease [bacterium]